MLHTVFGRWHQSGHLKLEDAKVSELCGPDITSEKHSTETRFLCISHHNKSSEMHLEWNFSRNNLEIFYFRLRGVSEWSVFNLLPKRYGNS